MTCPMGLLQWSQTVSTYLPHLSLPHRTGLALWSGGIVLAQSCGLTTVATCLASLLGRGEATGRAQLRDGYRDGAHTSGAKRGAKRRRLAVATCCAPGLRWVVACSAPPGRPLALALEASPWGPRCPVRLLRGVVRGCAIPVAWRLVDAPRPGAWRPPGEARCGHGRGRVARDPTSSNPRGARARGERRRRERPARRT